MKHLAEELPPAGDLVSGSSWMQITFTLDVADFKMLWQCAEDQGVTVPCLVRRIVTGAVAGSGCVSTVVLATAD